MYLLESKVPNRALQMTRGNSYTLLSGMDVAGARGSHHNMCTTTCFCSRVTLWEDGMCMFLMYMNVVFFCVGCCLLVVMVLLSTLLSVVPCVM